MKCIACDGLHLRHACVLLAPMRQGLVNRCDGRRVCVDECDCARAATDAFEPKRTCACERIDDFFIRKLFAPQMIEPVKYRLAHAVGRRAQTVVRQNGQVMAAPLSCDDADVSCGGGFFGHNHVCWVGGKICDAPKKSSVDEIWVNRCVRARLCVQWANYTVAY